MAPGEAWQEQMPSRMKKLLRVTFVCWHQVDAFFLLDFQGLSVKLPKHFWVHHQDIAFWQYFQPMLSRCTSCRNVQSMKALIQGSKFEVMDKKVDMTLP